MSSSSQRRRGLFHLTTIHLKQKTKEKSTLRSILLSKQGQENKPEWKSNSQSLLLPSDATASDCKRGVVHHDGVLFLDSRCVPHIAR